MNPRHYLDFIIEPKVDDGDRTQRRAAGVPAAVVAGAALRVLHGAFKERPGRYALALPRFADQPFSKLRVFAGERDDLDELVQAVESHPVIRDYIQLGYPRKVPVDYDGTWTEFRRYRIPARRSCRKPDDDLRERRMQRAQTERLPFFIMHSQSTGQQFGLYVEIRPAARPSSDGIPDSYGLSVTTRPFALPDLR